MNAIHEVVNNGDSMTFCRWDTRTNLMFIHPSVQHDAEKAEETKCFETAEMLYTCIYIGNLSTYADGATAMALL